MKNWYFSLKDCEEGSISEIKLQKKKKKKKKKRSIQKKSIQKLQQLSSKCKGILNKFEKGDVLRWSL